MNIAVVLRSIAYLKPSMIYWRIHRAIKGRLIGSIEGSGIAKSLFAVRNAPPTVSRADPGSRYYCEPIDLEERRFSFLNDTLILPDSRTERRSLVSRQPLLWQFHYGYHDYLLALLADHPSDEQLRPAILSFLLEWIGDYPLYAKGARNSAWHPYVISLRIEAWIRLAPLFPGEQAIPGHIFQMTRTLERNLERGTMANHFMKNIKALILAGLYFDGPDGRRFLSKGLRFLEQEIAEQVLDDGCHFERSPMYHTAMTSDVLDMIEALRAAGRQIPRYLQDAGNRMTAFLAGIVHPDGEVPFFNDSTRSFFLNTGDVIRRGKEMMKAFGSEPGPASNAGTNAERTSGLMVHRNERIHLVFDAGNVGPDYQPGHAHCDTLSFEASIGGKRFLTDTGVFHYRESPERTYCRSTGAHNTVRIDGAEQSEVWKSFRVGRRAKITGMSQNTRDGIPIFRGAHNGYSRLGVIHERTLVVGKRDWFAVVDRFIGTGTHTAESFLHFAPGVETSVQPDIIEAVLDHNHLRIVPFGCFAQGSAAFEIIDTEYYPAFGVKLLRKSVRWTYRGEFPSVGGLIICFGDETPEAVFTEGGTEFRIIDRSGCVYDSTKRHS